MKIGFFEDSYESWRDYRHRRNTSRTRQIFTFITFSVFWANHRWFVSYPRSTRRYEISLKLFSIFSFPCKQITHPLEKWLRDAMIRLCECRNAREKYVETRERKMLFPKKILFHFHRKKKYFPFPTFAELPFSLIFSDIFDPLFFNRENEKIKIKLKKITFQSSRYKLNIRFYLISAQLDHSIMWQNFRYKSSKGEQEKERN